MKKNQLFWLLIFLVGGLVFVRSSAQARAQFREQYQGNSQFVGDQVETQTLIPTVSPSVIAIETPESRVLPPVGSNAGLVIGASVLVLIIIGGVLGVRRKLKH